MQPAHWKIHTLASLTHSFNHCWAKSSSRAVTSGVPKHWYLGQNYLTSSLMTHAMGQSTSLASLQEWLIQQVGVLPFRAPLTAWANGDHAKFKGKRHVLHLGRNNPTHQYRVGVSWLEKQICRRGPGGQGGHELATRPPLGSQVQERHGQAGASPAKGHQDD